MIDENALKIVAYCLVDECSRNAGIDSPRKPAHYLRVSDSLTYRRYCAVYPVRQIPIPVAFADGESEITQDIIPALCADDFRVKLESVKIP